MSSFKEEYETITELGATVLAVSGDSLDSHRSTVEQMGGLPYPLLSDERLLVAAEYEALSDDGRKSRRCVYVIDQGGVILVKIPWFQPGNPGQFLEIFEALGLE